jgi:methionine sulfoxide reductase catalytic subunit
MDIRTPKDWEMPESSVTAQSLYRLRNRRDFLVTLGVAAVGAILSPSLLRAATVGFPDKENPLYPASALKPTAYDLITSYNNFYEFGTDKADPKRMPISAGRRTLGPLNSADLSASPPSLM